jgi:hypothetical protein
MIFANILFDMGRKHSDHLVVCARLSQMHSVFTQQYGMLPNARFKDQIHLVYTKVSLSHVYKKVS